MSMKKALMILALTSTPAFAQGLAPVTQDPADVLAHDRIQFGQLLIQLGNTELELSKTKKELDALKHPAPSPQSDPHK